MGLKPSRTANDNFVMRTRIASVFALLAGAGILAHSAAAATALHHYDFNGAGVTDLIGSANGGLYNGAVVSGGMLSLDGINDYVEFGSRLIPAQAGTSRPGFSVAFMAQELAPTSDRAEIISQGYSYWPGFYVGYYPDNRGIRIGDQWQNTGLSFTMDQKFHFYAVTADATSTSFYIDGVLAAGTGAIDLADAGYTRLGCQFQSWGEFFHGNIDELWIFQGALTSSEVVALVPEPSSLALLLVGSLVALKRARRK